MNDPTATYAPGWPGIPPRLTSSAKTGIGTAHSYQSPLWFTFSHGILNELYYPEIGIRFVSAIWVLSLQTEKIFFQKKKEMPRVTRST